MELGELGVAGNDERDEHQRPDVGKDRHQPVLGNVVGVHLVGVVVYLLLDVIHGGLGLLLGRGKNGTGLLEDVLGLVLDVLIGFLYVGRHFVHFLAELFLLVLDGLLGILGGFVYLSLRCLGRFVDLLADLVSELLDLIFDFF